MKIQNVRPFGLLGAIALAAVLIAAFLIVGTPVVKADTVTVVNTNDSGPGSLRQAIRDANPNDVITFDLPSPATITLTTGELFITRSLTIDGPGPDLLAVSGGAASRIFRVDDPAGSEQITVTLSGLTLRDGRSPTGLPRGGAAVWSDENLVVQQVVFIHNQATDPEGCGGALYVRESRPLIQDAVFISNSTTWKGGALCSSYAHPTVIAATFRGNSAAHWGGAIYVAHSTFTATNTLLSGNRSAVGGAFANRQSSTSYLVNLSLAGNHANTGGAIYSELSDLQLHNTILWGNRASQQQFGHQVYNDIQSYTVASHSDIEGSGGSGDGWDPGVGADGGANIDLDPLFQEPISATLAPTVTGNLHLQTGSPGIDAGDNALLLPGSETDLDGNWRIANAMVDMGAYEVQPPRIYLPLALKSSQ